MTASKLILKRLSFLLATTVLVGCGSDRGFDLRVVEDRTSSNFVAPVDTGAQLIRTGKYGLAVRYYQRRLSHEPQNLDVMNNLAVAYDKLGRFDLAERYYKQVMAMRPDDVDVRRNLAQSMRLQGRAGEASHLLAALEPVQPKAKKPPQLAAHQGRSSAQLRLAVSEPDEKLLKGPLLIQVGVGHMLLKTRHRAVMKDPQLALKMPVTPPKVAGLLEEGMIPQAPAPDLAALKVEKPARPEISLAHDENIGWGVDQSKTSGLEPHIKVVGTEPVLPVINLPARPAAPVLEIKNDQPTQRAMGLNPWTTGDVVVEPRSHAMKEVELAPEALDARARPTPKAVVKLAELREMPLQSDEPTDTMQTQPTKTVKLVQDASTEGLLYRYDPYQATFKRPSESRLVDVALRPIRPVIKFIKTVVQIPSVKAPKIASAPVRGRTETAVTITPQPVSIEAEQAVRPVVAVQSHKSQPGSTTASTVLANDSAAPVLVIANGAGVAGMADRHKTFLGNRGYRVTRLLNAAHYDYVQSVMLYPVTLQEDAEKLATQLPYDVTLRPLKDYDHQIYVRLGRDAVRFDARLKTS